MGTLKDLARLVLQDKWAYLAALATGTSAFAHLPVLFGEVIKINGQPLTISGETVHWDDSLQAIGIPLIFLFGALHLLEQRREKEDVAKLTEEKDDLADQKSGLEDRLAVAQGVVTGLLDLFALTLAHGLSLGTQGRASIFLTQADGESCLLVGRFSDNPTYKRPSRSSYSLTQGCMGRAWTDSEHEALDMPDTASTVTEWVNYQAKAYGMPKEEAKALPMKSRRYAGVRVDDSMGRQHFGVVIVESEKPRGVSLDALKTALAQGHLQTLSAALATLSSMHSQPEVQP